MSQKLLPKRLRRVLEYVPQNAKNIADIGYDHGYLLIALANQNPRRSLFGVEKREHLHKRFLHLLERAPISERATIVSFFGDGFAPLHSEEIDCGILTGLGERTICAIVEARQKMRPIRNYIVCTAQFHSELRIFFWQLGFEIRAETPVFDRGRSYEVIHFELAETSRRRTKTLSSDAFNSLLCGFESTRNNAAVQEYFLDRVKANSGYFRNANRLLLKPVFLPEEDSDKSLYLKNLRLELMERAITNSAGVDSPSKSSSSHAV